MNRQDSADDDLRQRFRALAEGDAAAAPSVARALEAVQAGSIRGIRSARASKRRRWYVGGLVGAASAAAVTIAVLGRPEAPPLVDLSTARWVAPTDFLLNTPGSALLRTVPRFTVTPPQPTTRVAPQRRGTPPRKDS